MTPRQEAMVAFIRTYTAENGYAPNMREIALGCGYVGVGGIHYAMNRLRDEGYVTFEDGKARTVRVIEPTVCQEPSKVERGGVATTLQSPAAAPSGGEE